jgi:hypothetical protein
MFGWRARIGYISPTVMEVLPFEFYRFAPDGVGLVGMTCGIDDWRYGEELRPNIHTETLRLCSTST